MYVRKNYGTIKQTYFSWEVTWNDFCICYCFRCCVMNFFGCIKEIMDNSFFYGMMEENTSKKAVYTAGFLLAVPSRLSIPYDLPIEKM